MQGVFEVMSAKDIYKAREGKCIAIPIGNIDLNKQVPIGQWYGSFTILNTNFTSFSDKTDLSIKIGKE